MRRAVSTETYALLGSRKRRVERLRRPGPHFSASGGRERQCCAPSFRKGKWRTQKAGNKRKSDSVNANIKRRLAAAAARDEAVPNGESPDDTASSSWTPTSKANSARKLASSGEVWITLPASAPPQARLPSMISASHSSSGASRIAPAIVPGYGPVTGHSPGQAAASTTTIHS